jgi:hypothetical protein
LVFGLSDDLNNTKFLIRCALASLISFVLGAILETADLFGMEKGMVLLLMSVSIIFLVFDFLLRYFFEVVTGEKPCAIDRSSKLGGYPTNGFWMKHPSGRIIKWTDYLFAILRYAIPILVILFFLELIKTIN